MSATTKLMKRFDKVSKAADQYNARNRTKRYQTMTNTNGGRIVEIGLYDTKEKKYAVTDIRAYNSSDIMDEIEAMLSL